MKSVFYERQQWCLWEHGAGEIPVGRALTRVALDLGLGRKGLGRWPVGQSGVGGFSLSGSDGVHGSGLLRK
jgi:hypothetical protein